MRPAGLTVRRSRILPPGKPAGRSAAAPRPAGGPWSAASNPLRVLIVDDHPAFAESLRSLLSVDDRIEVVGWAENGEQAVELATSLEPDLIVMDLDMPIMNGAAMIRSLEHINPDVRVLSASGLMSETHTPAANFRKLLPKPYTAEQLLNAVHELIVAA